jgi:uncharacterized protein (TIGR03435 family)
MSKKDALSKQVSFGRSLVLVATLFSIAAPLSGGQARAQNGLDRPKESSRSIPSFEVATIKPSKTAAGGMRWIGHIPTGLSVKNISVQSLVREAFGLEDDRILGAPGWVKEDRFDIEAKVAESDIPVLKNMTVDQRRAMLGPLLEERFNLKFHFESRVLPFYALVIARGGSKMKEFTPPGNPAANGLRYLGRGHLEARGTSMEFVGQVLAQQLGRTVVDKTGLNGKYDFSLQWEPDDPFPNAGNDNGLPQDASSPSLITALQEQLGLKLEARKDQISVLVIDHIEAPSPN